MSSLSFQSLINVEFPKLAFTYRRLLLPIAVLALIINSETRAITLGVISDAFWQVAVFVAATLAIYHFFAEKVKKDNILTRMLSGSETGQITFASLMGALPGCGGAIIVITQFVSGSLNFGAVVAVLTATMGDAAFLLLASQPGTGFGVVILGVIVGILSGLIVNQLHSKDFLRPASSEKMETKRHCAQLYPMQRIKLQGFMWKVLILPGAIVGLLLAAQVDINQQFNIPQYALQGLGAILGITFLFLWATSKRATNYKAVVSEDSKPKTLTLFEKVALDTNFVTSWVVIAFLLFELIMFYTAFDLKAVFNQWPHWTPLLAVIVGMLPGCGPQILTTTFYLNGAIPLSAQIGNAISNDGDALFPAIAMAPKVALWATVYSAIPAVLVAYGYMILFE